MNRIKNYGSLQCFIKILSHVLLIVGFLFLLENLVFAKYIYSALGWT